MKHSFILAICSLALFLSCAKTDEETNQQLEFGYRATELLKWYMRQENDSLISHLSSTQFKEELRVQDVRNESLRKIQDIEDSLIAICGGWNKETGLLINPLEHDLIVEYLIGSPKGLEFKQSVNLIIGFISKYDSTVSNLAVDPMEIKQFVSDPNQSSRTFAEVNFQYANLIGVMNTFRIYELFILQEENKFLNSLIMREKRNGL